MPRDVKLLVTDFPDGQTFSDIGSVAIVVGGAWGECNLCLSRVDLSRSRLQQSRRFDFDLNTLSNDAIYDRWYRMNPTDQRDFFSGGISIRKRVWGFAAGASYTALADVFGNGLRGIAASISTDFVDYVNVLSANWSASLSIFRGIGNYNTKFLGHENLRNLNICVLRGSLTAFVLGVACNLVIIGNFRSINSVLDGVLNQNAISIGFDALTNIATTGSIMAGLTVTAGRLAANVDLTRFENNLRGYLHDVSANAMAYGFIPEGSIGLVSFGADFSGQLVAS